MSTEAEVVSGGETAAETAVRKAKAGEFDLVQLGPPFTFGLHGLTVNNGKGRAKPTLAECDDALQRIQAVIGAIRYNRGDLLNYIEKAFPDEASQVIDADVIDEKDAKADQFVAAKVGEKQRALAKSFEHARAVAALPAAKQEKYLQQALDESWTASKLKDEASKEANNGKEVLKFWLVVECGTEGKRDKLAADLEMQGFTVKAHSGVKREKKAAKKKKAKAGPVTAQKRRGRQKMNTKQRTPK